MGVLGVFRKTDIWAFSGNSGARPFGRFPVFLKGKKAHLKRAFSQNKKMNGISTEGVKQMAVPKHAYVMDYISDKDTYRAVMFARQMIRSGTRPPIAIRKAAHYYQVDMSDVAHYVAQVGGRSKND